MPFGEVDNAYTLLALMVTTIGGIVLAVVQMRANGKTAALEEKVKTLQDDNESLRKDHEHCQSEIAGVKTEIMRQRDVKHDLSNFVTGLFGEMYAVGVRPERLEELRNKYITIMERGKPQPEV